MRFDDRLCTDDVAGHGASLSQRKGTKHIRPHYWGRIR